MASRSPAARPATPAAERILLSAHELFYRQGIRATGIDLIIARAGVSKLTFYRHFASKEALVLAFLDYRHERWMAWFRDALQRHGGTPAALAAALDEWSSSEDFRGCAFINTVGELAGESPAALERVRHHKAEVLARLQALLPAGPADAERARALAIAFDGAIVQIQCGQQRGAVLDGLRAIVAALS